MTYTRPVTAIALSAFLVAGVSSEPQPVVMVRVSDMPTSVPFNFDTVDVTRNDKAVALYHSLRKVFCVSHTEFAKWLGVKRRTMYNWINDPASATRYGEQIETRLLNLQGIKEEMEPEHLNLLHRIAFSPIYGDPRLGTLIINGASKAAIETLYEENFSLFEDYRLSKV